MTKLPKLQKRPCLRCQKMFRTKGPYHRICGNCKHKEAINPTLYKYANRPVVKAPPFIQENDNE